MSTIKISELRPMGSEFFQDSESYLNELSDREVEMINGGKKYVIISQFTISIGISVVTEGVVSQAFFYPKKYHKHL